MIEIAREVGIKGIYNTKSHRGEGGSVEPYNFAQPADGITWHGVDVLNSVARTYLTTDNPLRPGDVVIPYGHGLDIFDETATTIADLETALADTTYGPAGKFCTLPDLSEGRHWSM